MAYDFIGSLSESKAFPSQRHVERHTARELADLAHAMMCALRIMLAERTTREWARKYARRTAQNGDFKRWRSDATDLYVALYAVTQDDVDTKAGPDDRLLGDLPIDTTTIIRWLRNSGDDHPSTEVMRRIFVRLDAWLAITDSDRKAIRRKVLDWTSQDRAAKRQVISRLIQMLKSELPTAEMIPHLRALEDEHDDLDEGYPALASVAENATAGATSAASVAAVPGGLGAGFDPQGGWRSIYGKRKKKPRLIRR